MWRNTHPYVLVDRHEDITHPNRIEEDPECKRSVTFYGYVRGTNLKPNSKVHLIGVDDYTIEEVSALPDPCPLPNKDNDRKVSPRVDVQVLLCRNVLNVVSFVADSEQERFVALCTTVERRCGRVRQGCCVH